MSNLRRFTPSFSWFPKGPDKPLPITLRLIAGLLGLIIIGATLLTLPAASAHEPIPFSDALFTATSALTVTGLTVISTSADFSLTGHIIILVLIQVGGVGYMFAISLVLLVLGQKITFRDRLALSSSLGLNQPGAILLILRRTFWSVIGLEALGAAALYFHWRAQGIVAEEKLALYAIFHAVSAFCNAGFDLFAGLPAYPDGLPKDSLSLAIMGLLILIGGLGIPVVAEMISFSFRLQERRWLSLHTRLTLYIVPLLIVVGWVGIFIPETQTGGILHDAPLTNQLTRSLFQSLSARTAGFPGLSDFDNLRQSSQLLMMALMFIGCAPASMGGGITTGTFAVLLLTMRSYIGGHKAVKFHQRAIPADTVRRAGVILTLSLGLTLGGSWLLLLTHPTLPLNVVLFETVSAFATCGLSLGVTAELNGFGRLVLMALMCWGRLGALTVAMALTENGRRRQLVNYPEESVLI